MGTSCARQAGEAGSGQASRSAQLLEQGKMPQEGWHDRLLTELDLDEASKMGFSERLSSCWHSSHRWTAITFLVTVGLENAKPECTLLWLPGSAISIQIPEIEDSS